MARRDASTEMFENRRWTRKEIESKGSITGEMRVTRFTTPWASSEFWVEEEVGPLLHLGGLAIGERTQYRAGFDDKNLTDKQLVRSVYAIAKRDYEASSSL